MDNFLIGLSEITISETAAASIAAIAASQMPSFQPSKRDGDRELMLACLRNDNGMWELRAHPKDDSGVVLKHPKEGTPFKTHFSKDNKKDVLAALDALGLAEGTEIAYHGNWARVRVLKIVDDQGKERLAAVEQAEPVAKRRR